MGRHAAYLRSRPKLVAACVVLAFVSLFMARGLEREEGEVYIEAPATPSPPRPTVASGTAMPTMARAPCRDVHPQARTTAAQRTPRAVSERWQPRWAPDEAGAAPVNRAPAEVPPLSPALIHDGHALAGVNATPHSVRCWGIEGTEVPVPWFAPPLLQQLLDQRRYLAVSELLEHHHYAVLMGLDRFAERHAGARVREWPARWEGVVPSDQPADAHGMSRVDFSLRARSASAACFKQFVPPLHAHRLRCSAAPALPPLPLTLCAHIVDPWAVLAHPAAPPPGRSPLPGYTPALRASGVPPQVASCMWHSSLAARAPRPPLDPAAVAREVPLRPRPTTCIRQEAAPWLLPRSAVPQLPHEAIPATDLSGLLAAQADRSGLVLVAMLDKNYVDWLHTFVFSLGRQGRAGHIVIACLSGSALALCQRERMACYDAREMTIYAEAEGDGRMVGPDAGFMKPRLVLAGIELGYRVLMMDLDMVFTADPLPGLLHPGFDFVHQADWGHPDAVNSGLFYTEPNLRSWLLFDASMLLNLTAWLDQDALGRAMSWDYSHNIRRRGMTPHLYPVHCPYQHDYWHRTLPPKDRAGGYSFRLLHAACVVGGARVKEAYYRFLGMWHLDELDAATAQPYCILRPNGTRIEHLTARTTHSSTYGRFTKDQLTVGRKFASQLPHFDGRKATELEKKLLA